MNPEQDEIQEDTTSMEEKLEALDELNKVPMDCGHGDTFPYLREDWGYCSYCTRKEELDNKPKLASQQEINKLFGNSMIGGTMNK